MSQDQGKNAARLTVHNKISPNFHEIHVDGAFGGITPRGLINLNFFAERAPIPKSSEFEINDDKLGKLIKNSKDSKTGILREFEFGVYMTLEVAQAMIELLSTKISEHVKITNELQSKENANK